MIVKAGVEPASIGALPIGLRAPCGYLSRIFTAKLFPSSPLSFTTTERALTSSRPWAQERRSISMLLPVVKICRGRINTALWLVSISGGSQAFHSAQLAVLNILVSSEVSHRTATMVSRCRACRAWLAHSGYPLGHAPRSPRTAIDACAIRRMLSHLEAHSAI